MWGCTLLVTKLEMKETAGISLVQEVLINKVSQLQVEDLFQNFVVVALLMLDEAPHPLHHTPLEYLPFSIFLYTSSPSLAPMGFQADDAHHAGYHSPSDSPHYMVCLETET